MNNRVGMNEILIVNPSRRPPGSQTGNRSRYINNGGIGMLNQYAGSGRIGRLSQEDEDLYGIGQDPEDEYLGRLGSIPIDELGSIPMDELEGTSCTNCATEQIGYFSDDEDQELIGTYCPSCGKVGMGESDEALEGLAQYPGERDDYDMAGLAAGTGHLGQEWDDEIPGIEEWPDEDSAAVDGYGNYGDAEIEGQYDEFGCPADETVGYDDFAADDLDGYVHEQSPPFDPEVSLSGYQPERSVNPTAALRRTVPATPVRELPNFFKPYI